MAPNTPKYPPDTSMRQMADLHAARSRASFNPDKMTEILYSPEVQQKRQLALRIVESEPLLKGLIEDWPFLGNPDRTKRSWPVMKRLAEIQLSLNLAPDDLIYVFNIMGCMLPIFNHQQSFFAANLTSHASEEQMKHWGPLGTSFRFWGSFAQTELGHGSNVSALETTAAYDPTTQEFILNTPTLSSTKWWIGALGTYATHALVMAQLITRGESHGIAPFLVQVRSLETHEPMRGIEVGDIGPKMSPIENGWLRMHHVRVPRENLLSRNLSVTPSGDFIKPKDNKLLMSGMLVRRTEITASSARVLAKAATVGVRYGEVRRQNWGTGGKKSGQEAAILEYPMVRMRILPALAAAYSFQFVGAFLVSIFNKYRSQMMSGGSDFLTTLNSFHPTLSGLKAYCTTIAADGIEDIRRTLGGHGYSLASGLGLLYAQWSIFTTAEGEAVLMSQQTARYLVKLARDLKKGGKVDGVGVGYLTGLYKEEGKCGVGEEDGFAEPEVQIALFEHRARRLLRACVEAVDANNGELGAAAEQAYAVSVAHTQNLIVRVFWDKCAELEKSGTDAGVVSVLRKLAALNGLYLISKHAEDWLYDGHLDGKQVGMVRKALSSALVSIRPEAASLVDAWDFSDLELQSQLGRKDGNVYEGYFQWALREPLNKGLGGKAVFDGYEEFLKPLISGEVAERAERERAKKGAAKL